MSSLLILILLIQINTRIFVARYQNHFNIDLHRIKFVRFQMAGDTSVSAFPDGDNLFSWKGTIHGAKDTVS